MKQGVVHNSTHAIHAKYNKRFRKTKIFGLPKVDRSIPKITKIIESPPVKIAPNKPTPLNSNPPILEKNVPKKYISSEEMMRLTIHNSIPENEKGKNMLIIQLKKFGIPHNKNFANGMGIQ